MCFQLYAGTTTPIIRRAFNQGAPSLSVISLTEEEEPIRAHFAKPEVQYVGSTSACGCDFPHLMFQNGEWPAVPLELKDPERSASDQSNQETLVTVLRETGEQIVELYGIWNGDFSEPRIREKISIQELLNPEFYFKEQGFCTVTL
jgi:hypothetical protein